MKNFFLGRSGKLLVRAIVNLSIISLLTASTFIFISPSFAHDAPSFCTASSTPIPPTISRASCLNLVTNIIADPGQTKLVQSDIFMSELQTFLRNNAPSFSPGSGSSRGSVGPTLQKSCIVNTDTLTGTNPMAFKVGNVPYCDEVDWIFPDTANKTCQFQADGTFSANLRIDFYDNSVGLPNPDYLITFAFVGGSGTFSAIGTNIVRASLNEGTVRPNSTSELGKIKYVCQ